MQIHLILTNYCLKAELRVPLGQLSSHIIFVFSYQYENDQISLFQAVLKYKKVLITDHRNTPTNLKLLSVLQVFIDHTLTVFLKIQISAYLHGRVQIQPTYSCYV